MSTFEKAKAVRLWSSPLPMFEEYGTAKMFFPQYMKGREGTEFAIGESILEHIRRIGRVEIDSECGGQGTCGMDIVRIEEGLECLTKMTDAEMRFLEQGKLKKGLRLTCQARVAKNSNDVKVFAHMGF